MRSNYTGCHCRVAANQYKQVSPYSLHVPSQPLRMSTFPDPCKQQCSPLCPCSYFCLLITHVTPLPLISSITLNWAAWLHVMVGSGDRRKGYLIIYLFIQPYCLGGQPISIYYFLAHISCLHGAARLKVLGHLLLMYSPALGITWGVVDASTW